MEQLIAQLVGGALGGLGGGKAVHFPVSGDNRFYFGRHIFLQICQPY